MSKRNFEKRLLRARLVWRFNRNMSPGSMDTRILTVLQLLVVMIAPRALAQDSPEYVSNVVVVQFAPEVLVANKASTAGLQVFDRRAAQYGVQLIERAFPFLDHVDPTPETQRNLMALRRTYYVRYSADTAPERVSEDLATAPGVVYAEPVPVNRLYGPISGERLDPNDPEFSRQTELLALNLPEAWDVVKGSDGDPKVIIAVVDGGAEWQHEDLLANVWTNSDEIAGNGADDDNNGFIDDIHGANFANNDSTDNNPAGLPNSPRSSLHGTAVAGAAGGVTNNGVGIAGAAWNAQLMHVNVGCLGFDGLTCWGYEGILYAAANGADIINVSWGGIVGDNDRARFIDQTLNLATDMGALIVAAAGNSNQNNDLFRELPSRHPRVLSVGATRKERSVKATFSNYGKLVNVFAPGEDLRTTTTGQGYLSISGTSFSSPLVAGIATLVKTRFPQLTPDAVREQIRLTSESIDAENRGFAGELGRGFVNALAAVEEVSTLPAVRVKRWLWEDRDGNSSIGSGDVITITATLVNHLADANQLQIELVGADSYPYLQWNRDHVNIGLLARGDSTAVTFEFSVAPDAPANQRIRLFARIRDGAFVDETDQITLTLNRSLELAHKALSALYRATDGDNWVHNSGWDPTNVPTEEELGNWDGVKLGEGWVIELDLRVNNMSGSLPPELENLTQLESLRLVTNNLTWPIPPELGNLTRLRTLDLRNNDFSGPIPPELGSTLHQLKTLNLSLNSLSGPFPPDLSTFSNLEILELYDNSLSGHLSPDFGQAFPNLRDLDLRQNLLSGPISPGFIKRLPHLERLALAGNSFSGPIPSEIRDLAHLQHLSLGKNSLTGSFSPDLIRNFGRLTYLDLSENSLTGPIPPELGNLILLEELYLGGNPLTGPIPPEIGNLTQLVRLWLSDNSLSGPIPPVIGSLAQLQELNLIHNSLTGPIPPEIGSLTQLEVLNLSVNNLSGPIPTELGRISSLHLLNLGANSLSGLIPPELGDLTQLRHLYLDSNTLSGPIPPELGRLGQLKTLVLSSNEQLTGLIPPELGDLTQLVNLDLGWTSLSGWVPPELGNLSQLQSLYLQGWLLTGMLPRDLIKLDNLHTLVFWNQELCAPPDDEFQAWLSGISHVNGPTCTGVQFAVPIADQSLLEGQLITPLVLPEAAVGVAPFNYTLTPALPAGLHFDESTRTISGTPTEVRQAETYEYRASDAHGSQNSLRFNLEVLPATPVSFEFTVPDLSFPRGTPVVPVVLPEATGGAPPIIYTLAPTLPTGLSFDASARTISGTPAEVTGNPPVRYTYRGTDSYGSTDTLQFKIEVYSPVAAEHESLPESFVVHGNYPNPFRQSTRLVFDLPWPARVSAEVMDVTGRRVLVSPPMSVDAGWNQSIEVNGAALPSGLYVYRLIAVSPHKNLSIAGRFVHVR